jgi:preprotein translocase subunit SecG
MGVTILTILHYGLCFGLILIVLLQAGKGGGLAAAFGGGSSETIFGARRGNILTRITAIGVSIFMVTSLLLTIILPKQVSIIQKKGFISEQQMQDVKRPQIPGVQPGVPSPTQERSTPASPKPAKQPSPTLKVSQPQQQPVTPPTPAPPQAQQQPTQLPQAPVTQPPVGEISVPPKVKPPAPAMSEVKESIPLTPVSPEGEKE